MSGWVEARLSLVHKLLVETRIDRGVAVLNGLIGVRWSGVRIHLLRSVLEQLAQDALLLLIMNIDAFILDCTVELVLALLAFFLPIKSSSSSLLLI